jgi:hypothetical protein
MKTIKLSSVARFELGRLCLSTLLTALSLAAQLVCGYAQASEEGICSAAIAHDPLPDSNLGRILGTSNQAFDPQAFYVERFAKLLQTAKPAVGNFPQLAEDFLKVRIAVARKNKHDNDLLTFLTSEEGKDFAAGRSGDSANATSIYPPGISALSRYDGLYENLLAKDVNGEFTTSDDNEYTRRMARFAKWKHKVHSDYSWIINYEFIGPKKKAVFISGLKVVHGTWDGKPLFAVFNSFSKDLPVIKARLAALWDQSLSSNDPSQQRAAIAEFEWLFFNSNPLGRAAASIGDLMSLSLQIATHQKLRDHFVHLDFSALTMSKADYVAWRIPQMESPD